MLYRQEHPRPQFIRKDWKNLNGEWDFEIDHSISGDARGLMNDGAAFVLMMTAEKAKELGYDAGFGAGTYGDDVASFAVAEMVKRGMK